MGIEAAIIASLIAAGGSAAAGVAQAKGAEAAAPQKKKSFAGTAVDPTAMLTQAMQGTSGLFNSLSQKASQPFSFQSAYAQPVAGLSGVDPAYSDRSLLSYPGIDFGPGMFATGQTAADGSALTPTTTPAPAAGPVRRPGILPAAQQQQNNMAKAAGDVAPFTPYAGSGPTTPTAGGAPPIRLQFGPQTTPSAGAGAGGGGLTAQQRAAIGLALGQVA